MDAWQLFLNRPLKCLFLNLTLHLALHLFQYLLPPYLSIIMGVQIPDLQFTSLEAIRELTSASRKSFLEQKTRDVEFRLVQLRKLYWA